MKTLLMLRHAKSSHDDLSLGDAERPLNERGHDDAMLIGKYMRKQKVQPDLVLSSPAKRARQTTALVLKSAALRMKPKFDERIYEASPRRLLKIATEIDDTVSSVMLVGHNPGFEELLRLLTGEERSLPTASLTRIDFESDQWKKLRTRSGKLKWRVTPKNIKRG